MIKVTNGYTNKKITCLEAKTKAYEIIEYKIKIFVVCKCPVEDYFNIKICYKCGAFNNYSEM